MGRAPFCIVGRGTWERLDSRGWYDFFCYLDPFRFQRHCHRRQSSVRGWRPSGKDRKGNLRWMVGESSCVLFFWGGSESICRTSLRIYELEPLPTCEPRISLLRCRFAQLATLRRQMTSAWSGSRRSSARHEPATRRRVGSNWVVFVSALVERSANVLGIAF